MKAIVPLLAGPALVLALLPQAAAAEAPAPLALAECASADGLPHDWAVTDLAWQRTCLALRFETMTEDEAGRWLAAQGFRLSPGADLPDGHAGFTARFHTDLFADDGPVLVPLLLTAILHAAMPPVAIAAEWDAKGAFHDVAIVWDR